MTDACVQMLRRWLSSADDVVALTGLLVFLALSDAPLHQHRKPSTSVLPRPPSPRSSPRKQLQSLGEAQPPPLLTPGLLGEVTSCCRRLVSRRAAPYTRSVAFAAIAAVAAADSRMPCIDGTGDGGEVSMRDALVGGLAHAGFCGTAAPSCHALLAPLTPVFYHGAPSASTRVHASTPRPGMHGRQV